MKCQGGVGYGKVKSFQIPASSEKEGLIILYRNTRLDKPRIFLRLKN